MKLLRVGEAGAERPAVRLEDGRIIDVSSAVGEIDGAWLEGGGIARLAAVLAEGAERFPSVEPGVRIGAPVARPGHIIAIGLNFADHAKEAGMDLPTEPVIFSKAPSSYSGPDDDVLIPRGSTETDWEVELGVVIGRRAEYLPDEAAALEHVAGYCICNDVSERDFQLRHGPTWIKGKSANTFCPTGPWLVTRDEIPDPQALTMTLTVNGEVRQSGTTATMIFGVAHLVRYISQFMVIEAGDLISTGTPPGVGMGMKPPVYLKPDDVMELEIEGLGRQRQALRQA